MSSMEQRSRRSYPIPPRTPTVQRSRRGAGFGFLLALTLCAGCLTTPVTGRRALNFFSPAQDVELGREAYGQILSQAQLVQSGPEKEMVERVMQRLAAVSDDQGYEWHVELIRDDAVANAFALPGGKMAVYTGILPVCQSEAGLAVVMGHEIGHVVAQHGTQRMTQSMGVELAFALFNAGEYQQLARNLVGLTFELPYSRSFETEADHIGLIYMARAGYDPREAPVFWERMLANSGGGPPEMLSTHPDPGKRAERLRELMPEALQLFQANNAP